MQNEIIVAHDLTPWLACIAMVSQCNIFIFLYYAESFLWSLDVEYFVMLFHYIYSRTCSDY